MTGSVLLAAEIGGAVMLGAATQRMTGIGFALVSSPLLVFVLGPFNGVIVVNAFSVITALSVFLQVFRRVNYKRAFLMAVPAIVAIIPGSWVARNAPPDALGMLIGILIVAALTASLRRRGLALLSRRWGPLAAGATSGFMSVTAGVGGPAVTAYALATDWEHRSFAATAQLYFFLTGSSSLLAKGTVPDLDGVVLIGGIGGLLLGIVIGNFAEPRIPYRFAHYAVVSVAYIGALIIFVKGLVGVLT